VALFHERQHQPWKDETMGISAAEVKELRERTGAGMMDCKKALQESGGDMEAAIDLLRSRGAAKAAKRAGKEATEGVVASHISADGALASLVELNCETDFVARTDGFRELAGQLAEHVAAHATDVDGAAAGEALLSQAFMGGSKSVAEVVTDVSATTGEKIEVRRFARFQAGDGSVGGYVHMTGKIGVLVELSGSGAQEVARDVAMHVAAARPVAVTSADIPAELVERERAVYLEQVRQEGKPEAIQQKIVEGKIQRFYKEQALIDQPFVKDPDRTVAEVVGDATVRRFVRYELGD
jgi:elongation factor Ts